MKFLLALLVVSIPGVFAETIWVGQSTAGGDTGANAANCHSIAWANTAGNWQSPKVTGKIGPGDTVKWTGTISTKFTPQLSGTSGNVIRFTGDTGAKFSKAHWNLSGSAQNTDAAIYFSGLNYFQFDSFTVEATANGTSQSNTVFNHGIMADGTTHDLTFTNLTIVNLFVRDSGSSSVVNDNARGIRVVDFAGNVEIGWCYFTNETHHIAINFSASANTLRIHHCSFEKKDAGIIVGATGTGTLTLGEIDHNWFGDSIQWDDPSDNFHHDPIHIYSPGVAGHTDGLKIHDNDFGGDPGTHSTTMAFYAEDSWQNVRFYNNRCINSSGHRPSNGHVALKGQTSVGGAVVACNYFNVVGSGGNILNVDSSTGNLYEDNLIIGDPGINTCGPFLTTAGDTSNTFDYNVYYNVNQFFWNNLIKNSITQWRTDTGGLDTHSVTTNPNVDANGAPQSGSPAIDTGTSMASYFTDDYNGATRPQNSIFDIGAFEFASGGGGSSTPFSSISGVTFGGAISIK